MLRKSLVFVVMGTVMFLLAATSSAQVPTVMNYQGKLTTAQGGCVNDTVQMTFTIYADDQGTVDEWSEIHSQVIVKEGVFSVLLGSQGSPIPPSLFDGSIKYLGVQVESDPEMSPLKPLVSVGYAFQSATAAPDADWEIAGVDIFHVDGNVGIGRDNPQTKLHVQGHSIFESSGHVYLTISAGGVGNSYLVLSPASSSKKWQIIAREDLDRLQFWPGDIYFTRSGNVGIGTSSPAWKLDVAGAAHASSFPTSSDARFKKNVKQLSNVLEKLKEIRGVSFDWNELYESLGRSTGHKEIGVIAQEVEAEFPELVTSWGDENYKAVDYGRLTGVLIEAVKELKAENEALQQRIEALEGK